MKEVMVVGIQATGEEHDGKMLYVAIWRNVYTDDTPGRNFVPWMNKIRRRFDDTEPRWRKSKLVSLYEGGGKCAVIYVSDGEATLTKEELIMAAYQHGRLMMQRAPREAPVAPTREEWNGGLV